MNYIEGTVVENRHWTEALYSLRVEARIKPFVAGQFGRLGLDLDGERVARPYSFVNAPDEPLLEFFSVVVAGPLSPRLAALTPGDKLLVGDTPNGFLTLDEAPDGENLWLLATGTGVGPFLSILKTPDPWRRFARVTLAYGARHARELAYIDTLRDFVKARAGQFALAPFVSREAADFALPGRIPAAIESGALEERVGVPLTPGPGGSQVMLCGNPAMIKDTTAILEQRGLTKNRRREPGQISVERYW